MDVKQLTVKLLQQEFDEYLANIEFFGPHEEEDLDAIVWLHEKPTDLTERYLSVFQALRKENVDVPMAFQVVENAKKRKVLMNNWSR
ncbi:MAG: hypothetical protein ACE5PV_21735 [Candidatus Poribacteria bacterium]